MIGTYRLGMMLGIFALLAMAGCSNPEASEPAEAAPPSVEVAVVIHERVTEWDEFTGRLQAPEMITLVPRVSGYIEQVHFSEGALVREGDLLFQIDDRPFVAEVERLKAELQSAETAAELAARDYQRARELSGKGAISVEVLDNRRAQEQQASARVASVSAALDRAQLDLDYTRVTAPIDGRVSNARITAGNYVHTGQTELTRIVSTDKMYAYFDVDERTFLKYAQMTAAGTRPDNRHDQSLVYMFLADDGTQPYVGSIDFVDNSVNQDTGTIRIRASFENRHQDLLPGLFARIRLPGSASYEGILIDDKAIGTDLNKRFVLRLNEQNQAEYQTVTLGKKANGLRIIREGLQPGDRIVVNGLQRVMPNTIVQPQMVDMASPESLAALRAEQEILDQHLLDVIPQVGQALP